MVSVYSFKGTISHHADCLSHWIATFESLTSKLLWAKKATFRIHRKSILVSLNQEFQYVRFPIFPFLNYLRIWSDFCKIVGRQLTFFEHCIRDYTVMYLSKYIMVYQCCRWLHVHVKLKWCWSHSIYLPITICNYTNHSCTPVRDVTWIRGIECHSYK